MSNSFLQSRARTSRLLAERYEELFALCEELGLKAMSGDMLTDAQWTELTTHLAQDYLPSNKVGCVVLCVVDKDNPRATQRDVPVAAVAPGSSYFCGTSLVGGNHDWTLGELRDAVKKSMQKPEERSSYNPGCVVEG